MKRICSIFAVACVLAGCDNNASGVAGADAAGATVTDLPLKRGFYVSSDTACGEASHATLLLKRRGGISGARDSCEFTSIVKTGPESYRVTEMCGDLFGAQDGSSTEVIEWKVPDDVSFKSKSEAGSERSFRYCDQSSLPEDWRDADISDVIGE